MKFSAKPVCCSALLASALLLGGCLTTEPAKNNSGIDLSRLQWKMNKARSFSEFNSYLIEQESSSGVLTKSYFLKPDYIKIESFRDKELLNVLYMNGGKIWSVNPNTQRPTEITGLKRDRINILLQVTNPGAYKKIFSKVVPSNVKANDKWYVELVCTPRNDELETVYIYVDKNSYLPEIIKTNIDGLDYSQNIVKYKDINGIKMPQTIRVSHGINNYTIELQKFEPDVPLSADDFQPPTPWYEK